MNSKTPRTKSAISYYGSDSEVAAKLAAMLDGCRHVTIPFCGGMSILPHIKARAVLANDANSDAINFYRAASGVYGEDDRQRLADRCQRTLCHPAEMALAAKIRDHAYSLSIDRAWAYWASAWIGRKGYGGTRRHGRGKPSVRRKPDGGSNATRLRVVADDLAAWAEHFRRCEWESVDFRELLSKASDITECGVYCDPPWFGAGDLYLHSFSLQDHVDLRDMLSRFRRATVVVRYGDHPAVREMYAGWDITESDSRTQSAGRVAELWITNAADIKTKEMT